MSKVRIMARKEVMPVPARQNRRLPRCMIKVGLGDARNIGDILSDSIDFICTHPPYFNSLRYRKTVKGDSLSARI